MGQLIINIWNDCGIEPTKEGILVVAKAVRKYRAAVRRDIDHLVTLRSVNMVDLESVASAFEQYGMSEKFQKALEEMVIHNELINNILGNFPINPLRHPEDVSGIHQITSGMVKRTIQESKCRLNHTSNCYAPPQTQTGVLVSNDCNELNFLSQDELKTSYYYGGQQINGESTYGEILNMRIDLFPKTEEVIP